MTQQSHPLNMCTCLCPVAFLISFELWLEQTPESPSDGKEIQSVHPKGDQS